MKLSKLLLIVGTLTVYSSVTYSSQNYSGQQHQEIKALSVQEIDGYLNGKGMGFSRAAELNNFPGPRHTLDLASQLELTTLQVSTSEAVFKEMHNRAKELGNLYIENERKIEILFRKNGATAKLEELVRESGKIQSEIRLVHLEAHIKQKEILTEEQIKKYNKNRGYMGGHAHSHKHHH